MKLLVVPNLKRLEATTVRPLLVSSSCKIKESLNRNRDFSDSAYLKTQGHYEFFYSKQYKGSCSLLGLEPTNLEFLVIKI